MHILLIEDDVAVADVILKGLRQEGHSIEHAQNGTAAKSLATRTQYDVIILDRILPDLADGLLLLMQLRGAGDTTPVLILSGLGESLNRVSGLRAGGDDYMAKPFTVAELLLRVERLGHRGRAARQT